MAGWVKASCQLAADFGKETTSRVGRTDTKQTPTDILISDGPDIEQFIEIPTTASVIVKYLAANQGAKRGF